MALKTFKILRSLMKKLILSFAIMALVALSATAQDISRFLYPATIRGNQQVEVFRGWGLVDEAMLYTPIPQSALDQVYGEGVVTNLTLRTFCLNYTPAKEEGKVMFALSANYNLNPKPRSRTRYTSEADGLQWLGLTAAFGVTAETALNVEGYLEHLPEGE